jgi:SDR family mycofactocin-dependent oxidoreductase
MAGRVQDKVAFITGAARGQGRSHAVRLAEEGAHVIAIDACTDMPGTPYRGPTEDDLAETCRLVEAQGRTAVGRVADVRDLASLEKVLDEAVGQLGRLDIVSANAGIGIVASLSHELSESSWQTMLDVNLTGVWHTCRAAIPHVLAGGRGGSIVLTASTAALRAPQNIAHYVAAKHGVLGLMRAMANELGPSMIRVNSIHPTSVNTPMLMNQHTFGLFAPDAPHAGAEDLAPVSQALHALPIPWVEPIDVSNALLFLASDEARYISGVALPVDGGRTAKA